MPSARPQLDPGRFPSSAPPRRLWRRLLVGVVLVAAVLAGVDAISDATQVRPETLVPGSTTEIVLEVKTRNPDIAPAAVLPTLLEQCRSRLHRPQFRIEAVPLAPNQFLVTASPALGRSSLRKMQGCFRDLVTDYALASIESVRNLPPR
jgi:hypothetical protein